MDSEGPIALINRSLPNKQCISVLAQLRLQEVCAGFLDPLVSPLGDVDLCVVLDGVQEVLQPRVAVSVLLEVLFHRFAEVGFADGGEEALEGGGAFGVGDAVEDGGGVLGVVDCTGDWVGVGASVLFVASELLLQEHDPMFVNKIVRNNL